MSLVTMLITPAIASEPYCEAAPSRSTSIRLIESAGIALRSVPTVPLPNVPATSTRRLCAPPGTSILKWPSTSVTTRTPVSTTETVAPATGASSAVIAPVMTPVVRGGGASFEGSFGGSFGGSGGGASGGGGG